jgi:hypothetical protein
VRSGHIAMHVSDQMQLPAEQRVDVHHAELLIDAGCTAWTIQLAGVILSDEIATRREFVVSSQRARPRLRWWLYWRSMSMSCTCGLRLIRSSSTSSRA